MMRAEMIKSGLVNTAALGQIRRDVTPHSCYADIMMRHIRHYVVIFHDAVAREYADMEVTHRAIGERAGRQISISA